MQNVYYIIAVVASGLVCLLAFRLKFRVASRPRRSKNSILRRPAATTANELPGVEPPVSSDTFSLPSPKSIKPVLERELLHVRTPWGWARHEERNRGENRQSFSESMRSFSDRLFRPKELVNNPKNDKRVHGSIRALLEDRYGRVSRQSAAAIEYQKVKAPRLRDPSAPHDQMDNFGTREAERVRQKLKLIKAMNAVPEAAQQNSEVRYVDLKDVKRPWGW